MTDDTKITKSNWACLGYALLGVILLPTLPVLVAALAVAWPVALVAGLIYLVVAASK